MRRRLPLAYFHGIVPGKYLATWPVYVVGDDPAGLAVTVAVDDAEHMVIPSGPGIETGSGKGWTVDPQTLAAKAVGEGLDAVRRTYVTGVVKVRLHQRAFRERVLDAYQRQCATPRYPDPSHAGLSRRCAAGPAGSLRPRPREVARPAGRR